MLRANGDQDPYLRHAGVMGLAGSGDMRGLAASGPRSVGRGADGSPARLETGRDAEIAEFVNDPDPRLVLEAARAINDVPITAAMPASAALPITREHPPAPVATVLNANFRLGGAGHAAAMAEAAEPVGRALVGARRGLGGAGRLGQAFGP